MKKRVSKRAESGSLEEGLSNQLALEFMEKTEMRVRDRHHFLREGGDSRAEDAVLPRGFSLIKDLKRWTEN